MIIFYSGSAGAVTGRRLVAEPEIILRDKANIMLSFSLITEKRQDQHLRFPKIIERRKDGPRKP